MAAAAIQGFPEKPQQIPSKSHSNTLCKTSIIVVLLLAIPLFPSQAPDFITQSLFTEFWEIIHLLVIGIAISYGLFGRRTAPITLDKIVDSRIDDSSSYLSGISHLNSIFDDGYENICGPDEQDSYEQFLGKGSARAEEISNGNGKIVNQAWSSQYSKGKPLVVVSNGKYFLDDFKPLNLPVRSLRSNAVDDDDDDSSELNNRNKPSPKTEAKGNDDDNDDDDDNVNVVRFRGVVPINLEKKFDEVAGKSPIPWRSRSWRMRNGEETSRPAHYRPHSVGEFEFEHVKFSGSPELRNRKVERRRLFKHPHPKNAPVNVEALFSVDASSGLENNNIIHNSDEEIGKGKQRFESFDVDKKSSGIGKVLSRAKSVRTIKPNRYIKNRKEHSLSQIDGELEMMCTNSETESLEIGGGGEEPENRPSSHKNDDFDRVFPMPKPKPTLTEFQNKEKRDLDARNVREDEFEKNSDGDHASANVDNDSELEGSEVDRKAGEFIAKFREQIRLQKTS